MVKHGPPVNFTRPQRSACLKAFEGSSDPAYRRALGLIRKGWRSLRDNPRCDMPGFVPCEAHRKQLEHLARRRRVEARTRQAIVNGRKVHDRPADSATAADLPSIPDRWMAGRGWEATTGPAIPKARRR